MFHFGCQLSRCSKDITVETQSGLENWPKASPDLTIPHDVMGAPPDGALMTWWELYKVLPSWRHDTHQMTPLLFKYYVSKFRGGWRVSVYSYIAATTGGVDGSQFGKTWYSNDPLWIFSILDKCSYKSWLLSILSFRTSSTEEQIVLKDSGTYRETDRV